MAPGRQDQVPTEFSGGQARRDQPADKIDQGKLGSGLDRPDFRQPIDRFRFFGDTRSATSRITLCEQNSLTDAMSVGPLAAAFPAVRPWTKPKPRAAQRIQFAA
jgi:hypothetical protein